MQLISIKNKIKTISSLTLLKIIIFVIVSVALIANFFPYYEGWDSFVYGTSAISLAEGKFGITNELLLKTGSDEFVPNHWTKTVHNTAVPIASPAILGLSALFYLLTGYFGLFYIGPIFSISFLIFSERIATKLFGNYVGLFTLVLLSTDLVFLRTAIQLLTDNIYSLFFILGCFFLIKFFQINKNTFLLLSSVFLVISAFFRFNGIIFFPIEIALVIGFFGIRYITNFINSKNNNNIYQRKSLLLKNKKNLLKINACILIPWLIFFMFWFSFNNYYFGDPFSTYYSNWPVKTEISSIFVIDTNRFESLKFYSAELIPDPLNSLFNTINPNENFVFNQELLSVLTFIILGIAFLLSLIFKYKRIEVFVFLAFMSGILIFFSSDYATNIGKAERFMIPNLAVFFMLLGFIIQTIWKKSREKFTFLMKKKSIILKGVFVVVLIVVSPLVLADSFKKTSEEGFLYETKGVKKAKSGFNFNNPIDYVERFPLDQEGLTKNSIIAGSEGRRIVEYNVIPVSTYSGGVFPRDGIFNEDSVPQKPIDTMIELIKNGNNVYVFKDHWWEIDPQYFRHIEKKYDLILKDYSKTFCKMELLEITKKGDKRNSEADDICYVYRDSVIPKN